MMSKGGKDGAWERGSLGGEEMAAEMERSVVDWIREC